MLKLDWCKALFQGVQDYWGKSSILFFFFDVQPFKSSIVWVWNHCTWIPLMLSMDDIDWKSSRAVKAVKASATWYRLVPEDSQSNNKTSINCHTNGPTTSLLWDHPVLRIIVLISQHAFAWPEQNLNTLVQVLVQLPHFEKDTLYLCDTVTLSVSVSV